MSKVEDYRKEISKAPRVSNTANAIKAKSTAKNAKPLQQDPVRNVVPTNNGDSINFLASLMQATIFFDYFEHVASKTYKGERLDIKIVKLKANHPDFHSWSVFADSVARVLCFTAVLLLVVISAYKVLFK